MDEFFTAEAMYAQQMAEFTAEQEWEMAMSKIAQYDPYEYEDEDPFDWACMYCNKADCGCDNCHEETCECPDDQGNEDLGMEEGLFGWE